MILVDKLLFCEGDRAKCEVIIAANHVFMQAEGVPAHVGMELMAQTLAAMNGYQARQEGRSPDVGFLLGTPRFKTEVAFFRAGMCLHVSVGLAWGDDELRQFECEIRDSETSEVIQKATINAFVPNDLEAYLEKERPGL